MAITEGYTVEDNVFGYHYILARDCEIYKYRKSEGEILTQQQFAESDCLYRVIEQETRTFVK